MPQKGFYPKETGWFRLHNILLLIFNAAWKNPRLKLRLDLLNVSYQFCMTLCWFRVSAGGVILQQSFCWSKCWIGRSVCHRSLCARGGNNCWDEIIVNLALPHVQSQLWKKSIATTSIKSLKKVRPRNWGQIKWDLKNALQRQGSKFPSSFSRFSTWNRKEPKGARRRGFGPLRCKIILNFCKSLILYSRGQYKI